MSLTEQMKELIVEAEGLDDPRGPVDRAIVLLGEAVVEGEDDELEEDEFLEKLALRFASHLRGREHPMTEQESLAGHAFLGAYQTWKDHRQVALPDGRVATVRGFHNESEGPG